MRGTLRQLRMFLGLTQEDMAERLGIVRQTWASYEAHPEKLSFEQGWKIARAMGVPFSDIIFLPDESTIR